MIFFWGVGPFLVGNLMKHTIDKKKKHRFSNWMRLKLMSIFLMIFSVLRRVSCLQMADDSLIAWPCKGLVQVDSLDTTLSTVGTMPSIPEDGIAARDR